MGEKTNREVTLEQQGDEDVTVLKIGDRMERTFHSEDLSNEQIEANYTQSIHAFEMKRHECHMNMVAFPNLAGNLLREMAEYEEKVRRLKEDRERWRSGSR